MSGQITRAEFVSDMERMVGDRPVIVSLTYPEACALLGHLALVREEIGDSDPDLTAGVNSIQGKVHTAASAAVLDALRAESESDA